MLCYSLGRTTIRLMGKSSISGEGEGIIIERPKEEILSLARAGESQNLEYKYDVIEEKDKTDFI